MPNPDFPQLLHPDRWFAQGRGPRYQQLYRHLREAITSNLLEADTLLPPEREMAQQAEVSRVTIRKAVGALADDGLLDQRQGSGSFVRANAAPRLLQSLSSLVSFTETMEVRGYTSFSKVLSSGLVPPTPSETAALGVGSGQMVARITRLRMADPGALAIETSTLPADILPDPAAVDQSLYAALRANNHRLVRAIQRISAVNLTAAEAKLMDVDEGAAFLKIIRTGYLASGRPIEYTSGIYRSDIYDFLAEVRLEETQ